MSLLRELYFGNLDFCGYMPRTDRYKKLLNRSASLEEALVEGLEGNEKSQFIEYAAAQGELNGLTATESFVMGFSVGAALMG